MVTSSDGRIEQVVPLLKSALRGKAALDSLIESSLVELIPAVREMAVEYEGQQWAEARALARIIWDCVDQFLSWSSTSQHPRLRAEAQIVALSTNLGVGRSETMSQLARELGISRDKLYDLRNEAFRQIAWLMLQYSPKSDN